MIHANKGVKVGVTHTGQREQAREHLSTAGAMYREVGMGFWLAQAQAVLTESAT